MGADAADPEKLTEGQIFEASGAPQMDLAQVEVRMRGRVLGDGKEGWIGIADGYLKPWKGVYKCAIIAPLQANRKVEDNSDIRTVALGEELTSLDGPVVEGNVLRMRCRADKDGKVGWMTIASEDGKTVLRPL